jgi:hypothetical protein
MVQELRRSPRRIRVGLICAGILFVSGCGSAEHARASSVSGSAVRGPTAAERISITALVRRFWRAGTDFNFTPELSHRLTPIERGFRETVASIRVSRLDPRLAVAVGEVRDRSGRLRPSYDVAFLLQRGRTGWEVRDNTGTEFPVGCASTVARAWRDLICPTPWVVLGIHHPGLPASAFKAVITKRWRDVQVPGAICGSDKPLRVGGGLIAHSAIWPWWPAIGYDVSGPYFTIGDVNEDGQDDAYYRVDCNNTGGTGEGVFAYAIVVIGATPSLSDSVILYGKRPPPQRLLGIVTPQQPENQAASQGDAFHPALIGGVEMVMRGANQHHADRLVVQEEWYGPADPSSCCPSGRATSIWRYTSGHLSPVRTVVDIPPAGIP